MVSSSALQFSLGLGFMCSHGNVASTFLSSSWSLGFLARGEQAPAGVSHPFTLDTQAGACALCLSPELCSPWPSSFNHLTQMCFPKRGISCGFSVNIIHMASNPQQVEYIATPQKTHQCHQVVCSSCGERMQSWPTSQREGEPLQMFLH